MKILDKSYVLSHKGEIIKSIIDGAVFVYPTDTIYGLGVNALLGKSVRKIRDIKRRETKPFSVIAPSRKWIEENCQINETVKEWLNKLPGPFTFFLNIQVSGCVSEEVNPIDDSLGVRMPKHWFTEIIEEAGVPFVTTSVNMSGHSYMKGIVEMDDSIKNSVDYIIYEGEKRGEVSEKVDLR
jgi:L-threonylcarbamoyladenylate synthase